MTTAVRPLLLTLIGLVLLVPYAISAQSEAANKMCDAPSETTTPKQRYNPDRPAYPAIYTEVKNGEADYIRNLWRKPCNDNFIKAYCTKESFCDGKQQGSQCYIDEKWTDCQKPEQDVKATPGSEPAKQEPHTGLSDGPQAPDVSQLKPDEQTTKSLNDAFNPLDPNATGPASSFEQKKAGSADAIDKFLRDTETGQMKEPSIVNTVKSEIKDLKNLLSGESMMQPPPSGEDGEKRSWVEPNVTDPSTFSTKSDQPTQTEDCGWWCSIKNTAGNAWESTKSAFGFGAKTTDGELAKEEPGTGYSIADTEIPPPPEATDPQPSQPVLSAEETDTRIRQMFDQKTKDAQNFVKYSEDLLARSESQLAKSTAQTLLDGARQRLDAVTKGYDDYKAGIISPEMRDTIAALQSGQQPGAVSGALASLTGSAHQYANEAVADFKGSNYESLGEVGKDLVGGAKWLGWQTVGGLSKSVQNIGEALDLPGFQPDAASKLAATVDPIGKQNELLIDAVNVAPFAYGPTKALVAKGLDSVLDSTAVSTSRSIALVDDVGEAALRNTPDFKPSFVSDLDNFGSRVASPFVQEEQAAFKQSVARGVSVTEAEATALRNVHANISRTDIGSSERGSQILSTLEREMADRGIPVPPREAPTVSPVVRNVQESPSIVPDEARPVASPVPTAPAPPRFVESPVVDTPLPQARPFTPTETQIAELTRPLVQAEVAPTVREITAIQDYNRALDVYSTAQARVGNGVMDESSPIVASARSQYLDASRQLDELGLAHRPAPLIDTNVTTDRIYRTGTGEVLAERPSSYGVAAAERPYSIVAESSAVPDAVPVSPVEVRPLGPIETALPTGNLGASSKQSFSMGPELFSPKSIAETPSVLTMDRPIYRDTLSDLFNPNALPIAGERTFVTQAEKRAIDFFSATDGTLSDLRIQGVSPSTPLFSSYSRQLTQAADELAAQGLSIEPRTGSIYKGDSVVAVQAPVTFPGQSPYFVVADVVPDPLVAVPVSPIERSDLENLTRDLMPFDASLAVKPVESAPLDDLTRDLAPYDPQFAVRPVESSSLPDIAPSIAESDPILVSPEDILLESPRPGAPAEPGVLARAWRSFTEMFAPSEAAAGPASLPETSPIDDIRFFSPEDILTSPGYAPSRPENVVLYGSATEGIRPGQFASDPYFTSSIQDALQTARNSSGDTAPRIVVIEVPRETLSDLRAYRQLESIATDPQNVSVVAVSSHMQLPREWFDPRAVDAPLVRSIKGLNQRLSDLSSTYDTVARTVVEDAAPSVRPLVLDGSTLKPISPESRSRILSEVPQGEDLVQRLDSLFAEKDAALKRLATEVVPEAAPVGRAAPVSMEQVWKTIESYAGLGDAGVVPLAKKAAPVALAVGISLAPVPAQGAAVQDILTQSIAPARLVLPYTDEALIPPSDLERALGLLQENVPQLANASGDLSLPVTSPSERLMKSVRDAVSAYRMPEDVVELYVHKLAIETIDLSQGTVSWANAKGIGQVTPAAVGQLKRPTTPQFVRDYINSKYGSINNAWALVNKGGPQGALASVDLGLGYVSYLYHYEGLRGEGILAGYNGGPRRGQRLADNPLDENGLHTLTGLPKETRNYIQTIRTNIARVRAGQAPVAQGGSVKTGPALTAFLNVFRTGLPSQAPNLAIARAPRTDTATLIAQNVPLPASRPSEAPTVVAEAPRPTETVESVIPTEVVEAPEVPAQTEVAEVTPVETKQEPVVVAEVSENVPTHIAEDPAVVPESPTVVAETPEVLPKTEEPVTVAEVPQVTQPQRTPEPTRTVVAPYIPDVPVAVRYAIQNTLYAPTPNIPTLQAKINVALRPRETSVVSGRAGASPATPPRDPLPPQPSTLAIAEARSATLADPVIDTQAFIEFPRLPLRGDDAITQEVAIAKYLAQKESLIAQYESHFGTKLVNPDLARLLFRDIGYNGTNSNAVQKVVADMTEELWKRALTQNPESKVLLYTGSAGAGKSSAVEGILPDIHAEAGIILDGTLSSPAVAESRISDALAAGKEVEVINIYRDPLDAWQNGVISRMNDASSIDSGRVVPISAFIVGYKRSLDVVKSLISTPREGVHVSLIDNSRGAGNARLMQPEEFLDIRYTKSTERAIRDTTLSMLERGTITPQQYAAITGSEAPVKLAATISEPIVPIEIDVAPQVTVREPPAVVRQQEDLRAALEQSSVQPSNDVDGAARLEAVAAEIRSLYEQLPAPKNVAYDLPAVPSIEAEAIARVETVAAELRSLVPESVPEPVAAQMEERLLQQAVNDEIAAFERALTELPDGFLFAYEASLLKGVARINENDRLIAATPPQLPPRVLANLERELTDTLGRVNEEGRVQAILNSVREAPLALPAPTGERSFATIESPWNPTPNVNRASPPEVIALPGPKAEVPQWYLDWYEFSKEAELGPLFHLQTIARGPAPQVAIDAVPIIPRSSPVAQPTTNAVQLELPLEGGQMGTPETPVVQPEYVQGELFPAETGTIAEATTPQPATRPVSQIIPATPASETPTPTTGGGGGTTPPAAPPGGGGSGGSGGGTPPGDGSPQGDSSNWAKSVGSGTWKTAKFLCLGGWKRFAACTAVGGYGIYALSSDGTGPSSQPAGQKQPTPGQATQPPASAKRPADGKPVAGEKYDVATYCVESVSPRVIVRTVPAGTPFPANCLNGKGTQPPGQSGQQPGGQSVQQPGSGWCMVQANPIVMRQCSSNSGLSSLGGLLGKMLSGLNGSQSSGGALSATGGMPTSTSTPSATTTLSAAVALVANPDTVALNATTTLWWTSVRTSGCAIYAPGDVLLASSTPSGSTSTPPIATTTVFMARCDVPSGSQVQATTTVTVVE